MIGFIKSRTEKIFLICQTEVGGCCFGGVCFVCMCLIVIFVKNRLFIYWLLCIFVFVFCCVVSHMLVMVGRCLVMLCVVGFGVVLFFVFIGFVCFVCFCVCFLFVLFVCVCFV